MRSNSPLVLFFIAAAILAIGAGAFVFWFAAEVGPPPGAAQDSSASAPADPAEAPKSAAVADSAAGQAKKAEAKAAPEVAAVQPETAPAAREEARSEAAIEEENSKGFAKGVLLDFNGAPATGANVYILSKKGMGISMLPPDAETNEKGEFFVSLNVKKKKTMRMRFSRSDRISAFVEDVVFKPKETNDLGTVQFKPCASLEVTVLDPEGNPVPNAEVEIERPDEKVTFPEKGFEFDGKSVTQLLEGPQTQRKTGEDGVAKFRAIEPGRMTITANPPAFEGFASAGKVRARMQQAMDRAKSGESKNGKGNATIPEPDLSAQSEDAVRHSAPKTIDLVAGNATKEELTLEGLAVLSGRASIHGKPVVNDWLGLSVTSTSGSMLANFGTRVRARTDADGKFTFPPVPPGEYVVRHGDPGPSFNAESFADGEEGFESAMAAGMEMMKQRNKSADRDLGRDVELRRGTNRVDVDFGGGSLEVFVQDADSGATVADATIRLFDYEKPKDNKTERKTGIEAFAANFISQSERRPVRLRSKSDSRGRAEFPDVQAGSYRIIARAEGRPPSFASDFELGEGQRSRVIVKIPRGTTIVGTVNDRNGNALEGATVQSVEDRELEPSFPDEPLSFMNQSGVSTSSDVKGKFELKALEPGARMVLAVADGYAPSVLKAMAPSEGNQFFLEKTGSIRIVVTRGGAPAEGVIVSLDTNAKDAPIPAEAWSSFSMLMRSWGSQTGRTNEKGIAILKNVPPGEWTVKAADFSFRKNTAEKDASPGKAEDSIESVTKMLDETVSTKGGESADAGDAMQKVKEAQKKYDAMRDRHKTRARVTPEQETTARIELEP